MQRTVSWARTDGPGHGIGRLVGTVDGWRAHGHEGLAGPADLVACSFSVELDHGWLTRAAEVRSLARDGQRELRLEADGTGSWTADGLPRPDLDGCLDVDVAATPLTNTFPIRRLAALRAGEQVSLPVAWVQVPSLEVARVQQTYRRLAAGQAADAWQYADRAHGAFRLEVDADGLVVEYEGFAARVAG